MHAMIMLATALRRLLTGHPLAGPRLVIPVPPFIAGPGAHVEVGFCGRRFAVRLVRPAAVAPWPVHVPREPWDDPDDGLGRHDAWVRF